MNHYSSGSKKMLLFYEVKVKKELVLISTEGYYYSYFLKGWGLLTTFVSCICESEECCVLL